MLSNFFIGWLVIQCLHSQGMSKPPRSRVKRRDNVDFDIHLLFLSVWVLTLISREQVIIQQDNIAPFL